jgi:cyclic dehypoxanthinyl futalosine synthase
MLSPQQALDLYLHAPLPDLMAQAHGIRMQKMPHKRVTWQIDRNINIGNACIAACKFCSFHCKVGSLKEFTTSIQQYQQKIDQLFALGGNQILLQGGMHPRRSIEFYETLFACLKSLYPALKLHALGPAEIVHISKLSGISCKEVLQRLMAAGLDSLPGAGAEILVDRVRKILSPRKATTQEWCNAMHAAHALYLTTSATMVIGHIESMEERIEHLFRIRELQNARPARSKGFTAFIVWTMQFDKLRKLKVFRQVQPVSPQEYMRTIAISRIILDNIDHIQASWLTAGVDTALQCLHAGADDMGSIMIEENVLKSAGITTSLNQETMQQAIISAGFQPTLRNQQYDLLVDPPATNT